MNTLAKMKCITPDVGSVLYQQGKPTIFTQDVINLPQHETIGDIIDHFYIIRSGCCSVIKSRTINGKTMQVFVGLIEALQYFGDESFAATEGHQITARYTVIAGDYRKLMQRASSPVLSRKADADADTAAKLPSTSATTPPTQPASQRHNENAKSDQGHDNAAPELLCMSSMAAHALFGEVAKPTHWAHIDEADLDKLMEIERRNRKWAQFKRVEMTRFIKERMQDPNASIEQFRNRGADVAAVGVGKKVRWNV
jgi:hypothetical protein